MAENTVNEATRSLIESLRESNQAIMESTVAAQERNVRYVQSFVQNGTEVLKSNVNSARTLMQILAEQSQKQQETFQALVRESLDTYVDFLFTPFSYYRQAVDTAESIARQGVETVQKIARQGMEAVQKATRQTVQSATE